MMMCMLRLFLPARRTLCSLFMLAFCQISQVAESSSTDTLNVFNREDYQLSVLNDERQRLVPLDSMPGNNLKFDIRYSTANNFTGSAVYTHAAAYARIEVAYALIKVADSLRSLGLGLLIYDAYRPYSATVLFWKLIGDERYVANPSKGSRHNRGCAIDVGLYDLIDGTPLPMPTDYDDFSDKSNAYADCDVPEACRNRRILQLLMTWAGFSIFESEWWHFDFNGWEQFPVMDVSFEELMSM